MSSEKKEEEKNDPSVTEMENLLPEGEDVPWSWESGGYELTKRKIQDLNKTIRALKRGRTYKSYQERMKIMKLEQEKAKAANRVKAWKPVSDYHLNKVLGSSATKTQMNSFDSDSHAKTIEPIMRGREEKTSFVDAVRDVLAHRRQLKIRAAAFISLLPESEGGNTDFILDENLSVNAEKVFQRDSLLGALESLQKDFHLIECEGNKNGKVSDSEDCKIREHKIASLRCYMTNLYDILQTLVNIKNKDLKSKTAIPPAALRVLKQEPAALNQTAFRTRQNSGESSIKSWDEMLNMKSNENYAIPAKKDGITTNMSLWQILATEYLDDTSWMPTHASTVCSPAKETLVERMVLGWNQVRAKQAKDTEYAIKTIERKNMDRFRVLNFFLNQRHISFEHFCKKVADAFPEVRIQIRHDKDIEKISWLYELDDLCQNYKDADPTLQFPELKRLQRFFKIDLQEIPFIKAKVCLYVMSVPAYQILKCEIQKALMATLKILFLPESLLKEWLSIRHLPMLVTD